jgi:hypothetical protein
MLQKLNDRKKMVTPSELATARHPKGHSAHFVKKLNILHHLNVVKTMLKKFGSSSTF